MKKYILRAWRGEESLRKVFWVYIILGFSLFLTLLNFLQLGRCVSRRKWSQYKWSFILNGGFSNNLSGLYSMGNRVVMEMLL